jgi:carboxylesterase type B
VTTTILFPEVPAGTSEDCLFLDIYAPADAAKDSKKLPVFFWIQGGGFVQTGSFFNLFSGKESVRSNPIVESDHHHIVSGSAK